MENKILYPSSIIQVVLLFIISTIFATPFLFLLGKDIGDTEGLILFTALFSSLLGIVYFVNYKKKNRVRFNFNIIQFKSILALVLILFLFEFGINLPLSNYLKHLSFSDIQISKPSFSLIIGAVLFAPVLEEMTFRGIILQGFLGKYSTKLSVFLSSFFFTLFHTPLYTMPHAFIIGLFFGSIYIKTKSIGNTILLHSIANIIVLSGGYLINTLNEKTLSIGTLYGQHTWIIIPSLIILLMVSLRLFSKYLKQLK